MKKKRIAYLVLILFSGLFLFSCKKSPQGEEGPVGKDAPLLRGSIIGFVKNYDGYGNQIFDASGFSVTIKGDTTAVTQTNAAGRYEFENIQTGLYSLSYAKEGYDTSRIYAVQFLGGTAPKLAPEKQVFHISPIGITSIKLINNNTVGLKLENAIANKSALINLAYSTKNSVSINGNDYIQGSYVNTFIDPNNTYTLNLYYPDGKFPSGTKVYIKAYVSPHYSSRELQQDGSTKYLSYSRKSSDVIEITIP